SWRYSQVGANPVIVSSVCEYAIIRKVAVEKTLVELAAQIADECDVILTEGYRQQAKFIIEFMRTDYRDDAIFAHSDIRALVCDSEDVRTKAFSAGVPAFALDDFEGLATFIISVCAEQAKDGIKV
ncbi:MAG: molybdopterin-guanine dinucleotide biosynthesis protein MobB, partial [Actinobacteria bacterium]|nr:molybdopterin-guanine dinucleotide biosynthesis protein MobB [Actinomycetota bacterium]